MHFNNAILARRFTAICIIAAIFGMSFASLVISRPAHAYKYQASAQCSFKIAQLCY